MTREEFIERLGETAPGYRVEVHDDPIAATVTVSFRPDLTSEDRSLTLVIDAPGFAYALADPDQEGVAALIWMTRIALGITPTIDQETR